MKRMMGLWCVLMMVMAAAAEGQIPSSFFAMGVSSTLDPPKVTYGTLSHPSLVWTTVESGGRGVYNWKNMDPFIEIAPKDSNGVAQIVLSMGSHALLQYSEQRRGVHGAAGQSSGLDGLHYRTGGALQRERCAGAREVLRDMERGE
jgi:hypothetical protein